MNNFTCQNCIFRGEEIMEADEETPDGVFVCKLNNGLKKDEITCPIFILEHDGVLVLIENFINNDR